MPNFENNIFVRKEKEGQKALQENTDNQRETRPNKEERHKLNNEQEVVFEERKLAAFAKIMNGQEYYIVGGLAQEIDRGKIEYRHEDIDIIIFKDQEERIIDALKSQDFDVFRKPKFTAHDLEATNFDIDESSGQIRRAPAQAPWLYIGIYIYERNQDKKMAQRLEEDGTVNTEFPLTYFNKEKQTLNYKEDEVIIADLRLVATSKLISERPKDIEDVKNMIPLLKTRFNSEEIKELKNINKENIKNRGISNLKHLLEDFSKTGKEVSAESIVEYFSSNIEKSLKKIKNEDYSVAVRNFLFSIGTFTTSSSDSEMIKNEFWEFALDNFEPLAEYYSKIIDKAFE